ncbi:hypothetical protein [Roseateles sp.]|uniref:hypothetical protein n=1 Tax=Roseateles sp. TaxID=1971397 RepID=UPI0025DD59D5|nr:hypothetical protein [Roseateles sp.]MBV8036973.1 hypothetical protein [Roseateles sp.]
MTKRHSLAALALVLAASASFAGDKDFSMGIEGHGRTEAADVGLPVYAGAVPFREGDDDKSAVTLGAWAGRFGLKVQALKFRTVASPERVASFYAKALGRYGDVLDCRDPAARVKPPKDSDKLSCDGREPRAGDYEYRVGTARSFRVVSVKRDGDGARFDLAQVDLRF